MEKVLANKTGITSYSWTVCQEIFSQLKLALRRWKKIVNEYYVICEIQNSNFGTLANQHMCYQGHKSMHFTRRIFNSPWFLAKLEPSGALKTFLIRNKPKKVKIKSILLWYMFPLQIPMLDWRIISAQMSYLYILDLILFSVEFLIFTDNGFPLVVWC